MLRKTLLHAAATLIVWIVGLAPAAAVGSLLFAFDGNLKWLGLFGLPLLLLALRGHGLGCGARGCHPGGGRVSGPWPAP